MAVDAETVAAVGVLVAAHDASRTETDRATTRAVADLVASFTGWYDPTAIARMAKQAAALTRAGQRQQVTNTAAYWSRLIGTLTGRRPGTVRLVDTASARPVPLDAVYGRLADQYRYLTATRGVGTSPERRLTAAREAWQRRADRLSGQSQGDPGGVIADALRKAIGSLPEVPPDPLGESDILSRVGDRAVVMAGDNLNVALRAQLEESARRDPATVTGYRRVVRPELSAGGACGLCVAASTRLYSRGDLLPLHSRCKCIVVPTIGEAGGDGDVGGAINDADLGALYDAAGSTSRKDLRRTRYKVIRHGELGSWLVPSESLQDGLAAA